MPWTLRIERNKNGAWEQRSKLQSYDRGEAKTLEFHQGEKEKKDSVEQSPKQHEDHINLA